MKYVFIFFHRLWWSCLMFPNVLQRKEAIFSRVGGFQQQHSKIWMRVKTRTGPPADSFLLTYIFPAGTGENRNTFPRQNHSFSQNFITASQVIISPRPNWWNFHIVRNSYKCIYYPVKIWSGLFDRSSPLPFFHSEQEQGRLLLTARVDII